MDKLTEDMIAIEAQVRDREVWLRLLDGSTHSFPVHFYPRLASASPVQLSGLSLRVGGRALRWEELDEDIWVRDAVLGLYPVVPSASMDRRRDLAYYVKHRTLGEPSEFIGVQRIAV